ncbi:MAG: hypothetical protein N3I35_01450 [Clostridia bacterium]|nr:hypothetical protein [Clostridia bacterium]
MFDSKNQIISKIFNPLNINKDSKIEFNIGDLRNTGLYSFALIIEFDVNGRKYSRYVIHSQVENTEYIFEVFPGNNSQLETHLYSLADTIPFSEEFLEVVGQLYLTTPDGIEYSRCVMPGNEDRIEGVRGRVRVYNIETDEIEKEYWVKMWDYEREEDGLTEYLNIEMSEETGLFKIFTGEILEDIFYKFYQNSK